MRSAPATSRAPRLSRQERETQVLDTAARLFYARGVHEVGMDELVRATGLGKATVYRLYPTKDALVAAYLDRLAATIGAAVGEEITANEGDPGAALLAILDAFRQAVSVGAELAVPCKSGSALMPGGMSSRPVLPTTR